MSMLLTLLLAWSTHGDRIPKVKPPEVVELVSSILKGEMMGPGQGWFHAGETRYGWPKVVAKFDANKDGMVDFDEFKGPEAYYDRLDRDRNGVIEASDFDWSDDAAFLRAIAPYNGLFRRFDFDSNGRITEDEWLAFFKRAAGDQPDLAPEEFRVALGPPPAPRKRSKPEPPRGPFGPPPDAPTPAMLLKGLALGEIGSPCEGPRVGAVAPDFTLKTRDKKGNITLSGYRGKPVVLVFGSFT